MSMRTKSFFEQDHGPKMKPAQRDRHGGKKCALRNMDANALPAQPPIPATSQTKSKLKAFQFIPGRPGEVASYVPPAPIEVAKPSQELSTKVLQDQDGHSAHESYAPQRLSTSAKSSQSLDGVANMTPSLPYANTFPCTPSTRLPLEDLIGNLDEQAKRAEPNARSPEEQIGWIPNSSSTLLTPSRKRKRARSSSPSCPTKSSQRNEAPAILCGIGANKGTPEADLAADLWHHYGTGKEDFEGLKLPSFDRLVFQTSPRPIETPLKSTSLRRWASTGNDWPSSKNKRQRPSARFGTSLWQDKRDTETADKSKVAAILEKIQESLAAQKVGAQDQPAARVDAPSSSSPLPETGGEEVKNIDLTSPSDARQQGPTLGPHSAHSSHAPQPNKGAEQLPSGGADMGKDAIVQPRSTENGMMPAPLKLQMNASLPAFKPLSIARIPSYAGRQYPVKPPTKSAPPAPVGDLDEFGDAFDLSAEDLAELVTQPLGSLDDPTILDQKLPPQQDSLKTNAASGFADGAYKANQANDDADEFEDNELDEVSLAQVEFSATQAFMISPKKRNQHKVKSPSRSLHEPLQSGDKSLKRFTVKQVVEGEYTNAKGHHCLETVLLVEDERTSRPTAVALRGSWTNKSVTPGSIVHVAYLKRSDAEQNQESSPPGQVVIDDDGSSAFIIVNPDHMLSATTVADSFDCVRKAVLQDRIKATGETSKPMVYGKILHEIFQLALSSNQWTPSFLADLVDKAVKSHVDDLWELGMKDTNLAIEEIVAKMGELGAWAKVNVAAAPRDVSMVDDKQGEHVWMSISKLIAIEEHIWSPKFGLKGNIDATVQSTLVDHPNESAKKLIAPFEVKTGRTTQSPAHRAQTALYALLLSDRYDLAVQFGILYYLESSATLRVVPPINEIRQMIQQRNLVTAYIDRARHPRKSGDGTEQSAVQAEEIEESGLPPMLKNPFKCGRCYARQSCFSYHALVENGSAESAGMIDDGKKTHSLVWQEAVSHLALSAKNKSEAQTLKKWFTKWDRLLTFEEVELSRFRQELWTMSSTEREAAGRCFGNLEIEKGSTLDAAGTQKVIDGIESSGGKINRFSYVFRRATQDPCASFAEGSQLTVGEPVVVSSEQGQWALANGYVIAVTRHKITVAVDRRLGDARQRLDDFDDTVNQGFRGIMTVGDQDSNDENFGTPTLYRIDKDEFSNGLALVRNNLVSLMSSHSISTKLRQQVVFGDGPSFAESSQLPTLLPSQVCDMNEDQQAAVDKVLTAQDYALILGMPGTGKTTTIAHIIRALLAEEKSILLTSFTHTAVDNILLKIRDIAPRHSILRLGVPAKINKEVKSFCHLAATPRKTIDEIEDVYMGCKIVATSCMGTSHPLFNRRAFDVCIVDEASQISLPTSLGPLLHARTFVLVGDHYQLPPLVQNRDALAGGLDVSLFRQLSEEHPEAVATLGQQYRMCEEIMALSNTLIYSGQLRSGSEAVAGRTLQCNPLHGLNEFHKVSATLSGPRCTNMAHCWLANLTRPENKVVFANTDGMDKAALETLSLGKNITNYVEATITAQLVLSLVAAGVPGQQIGVITLYRSQLALMRQLFKAAAITAEVEIDSADRFQGRDKECIILSMVRSNEQGIVGDLLRDWRRVNVALTRARSKLIVLGSRQTLKNNELLAKFLELVDERGWTYELPRGADSCHSFDFSSQSAATLAAQSTPSPPSKGSASPKKAGNPASPHKTLMATPSRVLMASPSAGNRGPAKPKSRDKATKSPVKVIKGNGGMGVMSSRKLKLKLKHQIAMDIFEDLTADDL